jgi:hypothetical protein
LWCRKAPQAIGQLDEFRELQTGTARRIVDQDALDRRRFGLEQELGAARYPSLRTDALIEAGMLHNRGTCLTVGIRAGLIVIRPHCEGVYRIDQF